MSAKTTIAWTDSTWNPIRGTAGRWACVRYSPGCERCYSEAMNRRFGGPAYRVGADTPRLDEKALSEPLRWRQPRKVFVCSMTDLFWDQVPDEWIDGIFAVMAATPHHTYQVLTKRADRLQRYLSHPDRDEAIGWTAHLLYETIGSTAVSRWAAAQSLIHRQGYQPPTALADVCTAGRQPRWPLPNVWIGVSAEDQRRAEERIPLLIQTPAAVRFLSCEPLLGPIDLARAHPCGYYCDERYWPGGHVDHGFLTPGRKPEIDWVIAGGESGPNFRPMDLEWARSIRDQCQAANVPFFFKQISARSPGRGEDALDGRIWHEMPRHAAQAEVSRG